MKAIVQDRFGSPDVLRFTDVDPPEIGADDVLVRVHAAAINPYDWHVLRGDPYVARLMGGVGLTRPKHRIAGADGAGRVERVGANVRDLRPGDEVLGWFDGSFAEFARAPADRVVLKPESLSFEEAAAVPMAGETALRAIRDVGEVRPGHRVLVNGAAGGVGHLAVQIAVALGAEVTGVCSTRNVELVRSLGADHVLDYTKEDFTKGAERYDLILDMVGNHGLLACRSALTPDGRYVMIGGPKGKWLAPMDTVLRALVLKPFVKQQMGFMMSSVKRDDLLTLRELMASGKLKPVIDRTYALSDVPEAIRYLEEGRARGKVVISLAAGATNTAAR